MDDYRTSEESQAFEPCVLRGQRTQLLHLLNDQLLIAIFFCLCLARWRRKEECRPWVRWARPIRGKWLQAGGCSATSISCLRDQLIRVSFEESSCAWCQLDSHRRADSLLRHPSHHLFLSLAMFFLAKRAVAVRHERRRILRIALTNEQRERNNPCRYFDLLAQSFQSTFNIFGEKIWKSILRHSLRSDRENVSVFSLTHSRVLFFNVCRCVPTCTHMGTTNDLLCAQENSQLILISSPSLAFALLMKRSELLQKSRMRTLVPSWRSTSMMTS